MKNRISMYVMAGFVFVLCYPLIFIVLGALMGEEELFSHLSPVLVPDVPGFASWPLLPERWSTKGFLTLLVGDTGYFQYFWNSLDSAWFRCQEHGPLQDMNFGENESCSRCTSYLCCCLFRC